MSATLLISWYSVTGVNARLARAAWKGARRVEQCQVIRRRALETRIADLEQAQGYLFIGPENFGQLAGGLRMMFEHAFYPLETALQGRPYASIVGCGNDGHGAVRDIDRICAGWRLKRVAEALIVHRPPSPEALKEAEELGAALAEGLAAGVF